MELETVIGLEVHVELATHTKLFCGCANRFGADPNSLTCPVCLGLPGVLPVVNRKALELHILAAKALNCKIAPWSKFDRKNYFYPDMPKNFQTSQYDLPLAEHGWLEIAEDRVIGITRIHLEEDTGKSVHLKKENGTLVGGRLGGSDLTLVDYNRAGVPLLEIVSEPDMRTPDEASEYVENLREILRWLEISDCKMEEGSLRCDANVSLRPVGQRELGVKTEIKNMNSLRSIRDAIAYEVERQAKILREGGEIVQETRGWDEERQLTISQRTKEEAHDYRYFPEPDLAPMTFNEEAVAEIVGEMPELPAARRARYRSALELSTEEARLMTGERASSEFFEEVVAHGAPPKEVSKWMMNEVARLENAANYPLSESLLRAESLAGVIELVAKEEISAKNGQKVVERLFLKGGKPRTLAEEMGLLQISDTEQLRGILTQIAEDNPSIVEQIKEGKKKAFNVLVGQAMKQTRGRANPKEVNKILQEILSGR